MKKTLAAATAALATATMVAACGGEDENARPPKPVNKDAPYVITFNNGYPDVQTRCDGYGHRVYVNSDGSLFAIKDSLCPAVVQTP